MSDSDRRVRLRIIRAPTGSVDGIPLGKFFIGATYDVATSLADYLFAEGYAVPVDAEKPALVTELDNPVAQRWGHRAPSTTHERPRRRR
jgi:hypothetical protein